MWGRKGGAQGALGVPGQERPGARPRSGAAPVTLRKTDPEGKIRAPHSRLPPPSGGLGTVPGALAPSHELHDEVRTSARDRVAAPSPLGNNLSRHPQIPETVPPLRRPLGSSPQAPPHTFRGRRGNLAHPAHLCALGPGCRGRLAVPGPEGIHFGFWGHHRAELLLGGVKSRSRDRNGDRGRRAGGRHGRAGLRGPERARRVSGGLLGAGSTDSASQSGAASSRAGRDTRKEEGGRREGAGRERRPDHTRSGPERGRGERGRADQAGNSPRKGP